jgi:chromosomal replication initiation ATPase DnaA
LTVERIARQAAELGAVPLSEATGIGRGRRQSEVRLLTAWASREVARISIARVAKYFSRDASTLAKGLVRLEERMEKDRDLRRTANRLAAALRRRQ